MNIALQKYIDVARSKGHKNDRIKQDLVDAGWELSVVEAGLSGEGELDVPPPPPSASAAAGRATPHDQAVLHGFSTRGLEYIIMFIALGVAATSLGSLLHSNVNNLLGRGDNESTIVSLAAASLIVALPIFGVLFLRLKRAERTDHSLYRDTSRKLAVQLTLIITFLVGLGNIIYFLYNLMSGNNSDGGYNEVGSQTTSDLLGNIIHLTITLLIAGGMFAYYWLDEHRKV